MKLHLPVLGHSVRDAIAQTHCVRLLVVAALSVGCSNPSDGSDPDAATPDDAGEVHDAVNGTGDASTPDLGGSDGSSPGSDAGGDATVPPDASTDASTDTGSTPSILGGVGSSPSDAYPPTAPVTDADWFVNGDDGDDGNSGRSRDDAFATLGAALGNVSDGERIIVEGTLYPTSRVSFSDEWDQGVEIFNYGEDRWILDFSGLSDTRAVSLSGRGYHVKGVEIRNVPGQRGVDADGTNNTLEGFVIHHVNAGDTGTGIESYGGSFNIYQDGLIYHLGDGTSVHTNTGDCMALTGTPGNLDGFSHDNYVVRVMCVNGPDDGYDVFRGYDNYFIDSVVKDAGTYWNGNPGSTGGDGFGFKMGGEEGSGRNHFIGCIAVGSRNDGYHHNGATEACVIESSTAVGNGRWGFDVGSSALHDVTDSIAFGNADGPHYQATSGMVNNTWNLDIDDPSFVAPDDGDFSLAEGSAAIGAALDGDHLGASRAALELLLRNWDVE